MKFKTIPPTQFGYQESGKIFIDQFNENTKDVDRIYLSPEQFRAIENWFLSIEEDIDAHWNMGVEK